MRAADPNEVIEATIVIRRPLSAQEFTTAAGKSRAEIEQQLAANAADMAAVLEFVRSCGLSILEQSAIKRMVRVAATVPRMNAAFGVELGYVEAPGGPPFLSYEGPLKVPESVAGAVTAVLGLHRAPVARPR